LIMPSIDDGYGNARTTASRKSSYSGGGNQKTPAEKAADKERARLKKIEEQRANLSSEVNKSVRPATPIKSTAVTTALGSTYKKTAYDIAADKAYLGNSGKGDRAVSPSITSLSTRDGGTSGSIFDMSSISGISSTPKATSTVPTTSAYVSMYENQSPTGAIDYSKSTSTDPNDGKNLSFNNQTVAAGPDKYNQEYYAKLKANGMSTANILDIQKQAIGGNAYSGATIVSEDQKRGAEDTLSRVTGSMATLQNGGVTRKYTQSGLLGEFVKGEFNWKDGTNVTTLADDPVLRGTFNESTGRIEGGIRLGSRQVTTFAGRGNYTGATAGTGASTTGPKYAVNTMSGGEDGLGGGAVTTTLTAKQSATLDDVTTGKVKLDDIVDSTTIIDAITTVEAVDGLIATTTDPDILKSLYQRRLSLMRLSRTRTRFAGLLDDPDTKKSQMSIV
jgi:hypothetical protein